MKKLAGKGCYTVVSSASIFPLWFIRTLFIYNLLTHCLNKPVLRFPAVWFALVLIFWHTIFSFMFIEGQGLFFFTLGIWLCKRNYPIHRNPMVQLLPQLVILLGTSVIKTFMAFELEPEDSATRYILYALHDVSIAAVDLPSVWGRSCC
jgi:hypothetical protein